jgi:hypothetical protein
MDKIHFEIVLSTSAFGFQDFWRPTLALGVAFAIVAPI